MYLRLQVSMCKSVAMHKIKALEQLKCNQLGLVFGQWLNHVLLKISQGDVLHANEQRLGVFKPTR